MVNRENEFEHRKSQHAALRQDQMGVSDPVLKILLRFGESLPAKAGCTEIYLPKKKRDEVFRDLKRAQRDVERAANTRIILSADETIVTVKNYG